MLGIVTDRDADFLDRLECNTSRLVGQPRHMVILVMPLDKDASLPGYDYHPGLKGLPFRSITVDHGRHSGSNRARTVPTLITIWYGSASDHGGSTVVMIPYGSGSRWSTVVNYLTETIGLA